MRLQGGMLTAGSRKRALACSVEEPTSPTGFRTPVGRSKAGRAQHRGTDDHDGHRSGRERRVVHLAGQRRRWPAAHHLPGPRQPRPEVCHLRQRLPDRPSNWTKGFIDQTGSVGQHSSLEVGSNGRGHVAYREREQPGSQVRDLRAGRELQPGRELDQGFESMSRMMPEGRQRDRAGCGRAATCEPPSAPDGFRPARPWPCDMLPVPRAAVRPPTGPRSRSTRVPT